MPTYEKTDNNFDTLFDKSAEVFLNKSIALLMSFAM